MPNFSTLLALVLFATGSVALAQAPAFASVATYYGTGSGSTPQRTATADVNGDGRPDLLTTNYQANTAGVLLNTTPTSLPSLTALSPRLGTPGTVLTLTGTDLTGTTSINFTGSGGQKVVTSGFTVDAAGTQITDVVVPPGAQSGPVTVTAGGSTSAGSMAAVFWRASVVATGSNHSVAVRADGTLWGWGYNNYGQAGAGAATSSTVPVQIGTGTTWVSVAAGSNHSLALRADGTLWAWGLNNGGQLGNGTTGNSTPRPNPAQVGTGTTWANVAANNNYSAAVRADGTLWNWGLITVPGVGQTGNITQVPTGAPAQVGTATNWVTVACGSSHMAGVRTDGTLWTWGTNGAGSLGNGTQINSQTPQQVGAGTNWVSATTGNDHTVAVQADGTLWAWGNNSSGQVGDGTSGNQRLSPVQVGASTAWVSAVAGSARTLAVQASGTLWAWGNNNLGQLGDGSIIRRTSPVQVGTAISWVSTALGSSNHSLGEQSCRGILAWGDNTHGQVGDGSITQRTSPVQVYNPTSQLSSISPTSATAGTTITVTGTNLNGITALTVNGATALASVTSNTNTGFTFVVPAGATPGAGAVTVATGCGTTSSTAFTVLAVPVLTSFNSASSPLGSTITLNGSNLTGASAITFTGSSGNIVTTGFTVNAAGTQITGVIVPSGAATGNVTVTTGTGTSNGLAFTVTAPLAITSTSPVANARAASTTGPVSVTFSQALTSGSTAALKVFSAQQGGLRSGSSGSTSVSGSMVSFAPAYNFKPGEMVQATVTAAAMATAGGSLAAPRVVQFITAAGVGPGRFGGGSTVSFTDDPDDVAVGDVDGDGDLDLLTTMPYEEVVGVRLNNGLGSFSGSQNVSVGRYPSSLVVGDLDGDGDLDLVTADDNSIGTASVRFNNGAGIFSGSQNVSVGNRPQSVAVGDVDGDGDLDLLTANNGSNNVSVRFNNGTGIFSGAASVSVGAQPRSLDLGDVDGDGDLDLVTANFIGSTSSVRFNDGLGNFISGSEVSVDILCQDVTLGDVDGDNDLDLLVAAASRVSMRLNDGMGNFSGTTSISMGGTGSGSPFRLAMGDVDGDSDLDLLATMSSRVVSVRLNDGTGGFNGTGSVAVGTDPHGLALGDVDGDGDLDLLAANNLDYSVSVRLNQILTPTLTTLSPASGPLGSTIILNGSNLTGATAITFAGSSGNTVTTGFTVNAAGTQITGVVVPSGATMGNVTITTPSGTSNGLLFTVTATPLTITSVSPANGTRAAATNSSVAVTFDQPVGPGAVSALQVFSSQRGGRRTGSSGSTTGSGSTVSFAPGYAWQPGETVQATITTAATSSGGGTLAAPKVWQFTTAVSGGTGTFVPGSEPAVGSAPFSVAAADVNNDGYPDFLAANANSNTVSVRLNSGSGTFAGTINVPVGSGPFGVVAADVNGDGRLDILTANQGANTASISLGNGSGGFGAATSVGVGSGPWGVTAADLDGDGDLDLLTANHSTNTVSVRFNNGSGTFSGTASVTVGSAPFCVVAADVDNDGDLDLLTANEGSSTVSVRLNNGSGTFLGATELPVGSAPQSVVAADLNGDGALDVATANHNGNNLSVLFNNGSGTFGAAVSVAAGAYACGVIAADVEGDGDLDLLATNFQANTVSVRLNNGSGVFSGTTNVPVGSGPIVIATADVDQDGDLDWVTANQTANTVSVRLNQSASFPNLVVSTGTAASPTAVAPGTYNSITVTNTGVAQFTGGTVVNSSITVNGTLLTNCQPLTGAASFTVAAGATLGICDPAGLSSTAGTGAVRTTGLRSFSAAASYSYNGTAAQVTGNALPAQVLNLTTTNAQPVTLTQPVQVQQVLTVAGAGNLVLSGQALTLLSGASGTALVVNSGTGVVQGSTGTMQRYIDASGNAGTSGYRHYSSPVSGSTVADLSTGTFTPMLNPLYNTSATPTAVQPFPTVFGYDETRLATSPATGQSDFDKGWYSPAALTDALAVGRGYTVQLGNAELVDFTGTFNTGPRTLGGLSRGSQADAGWHLVGNPYPAPLDWSTVASSQLNNVNAAIYLYQSMGAYVGQYRALVNGIGAGSSLIPAGQGFFVRASTAGATGSIALTNANRSTVFAGQPALQRTVDLRTRLRLSLGAGSRPATPATAVEETFVYLETGATTAFDGTYDAHKLPNSTGYYLASASTDAAPLGLSINGRPLPGTTDDVVPLWLSAPAGTYTLTATELANLTSPTGPTITPYLRDALTGTLTDLSRQASYSFAVAPGAPYTGRFALVLRPASVLATASGALLAGSLASLYPNPTAAQTTLSATGLPATAATLEAELLDAVGRVVGRYTLPVRQGLASQALPTAGLGAGLYLLRLTAHTAQAQALGHLPSQRLVVR
jgi:alpha-tubulin suppressor-like RCC1 family protein